MKKVLITGANSYIGTSFEAYVHEHYAQSIQVDTIDMIDGSWRDASFAGYDSVIHVAAIVHKKESSEASKKYWDINYTLPIKVAKKAKNNDVGQFIFFSSMSVYGISEGNITKDTIPEPKSLYGKTKYKAENDIKLLQSDKFRICVLRPPMVYGQNCRGNYSRLANFAKKTPIFPKIENERSMLYIENLCEFLYQCISFEKEGLFFPQNTTYVNTSRLVKLIGKANNKEIMVIPGFQRIIKKIGKYRELPNKIFGNLTYDFSMSDDLQLYSKYSFGQSIARTEKKKSKECLERKKTVLILNCFEHNEGRAKLLLAFFEKKGYKTKVIQSNFRHIGKTKRIDKKEGFEFIDVVPYSRNLSVDRLRSHIKFSKDCDKIIEKEKPDVLYIMIPPNSLAKVGAQYRVNNSNSKLIYDIIDLWSETMPFGKLDTIFPLTYWKKIRDMYLNEADLVLTECNMYQVILEKVLDKRKTRTLYLAREKQMIDATPNLDNSIINLCYLGSINNIIDISIISRIIMEISKIKPVKLHIVGDGEKRDELVFSAKQAGACVDFYGRVFDDQKKQSIFNQCHFGLNIMKDSVCVGLTMKSIDYFQAGLPIINNIKGDTHQFVKEYLIGVNCDDNDFMKKILDDDNLKMRNATRDLYEKCFTSDRFYASLQNSLNLLGL